MSVKCDVVGILATIEENRKRHASIVEEAKRGYLEKAEKALTEKLEKIKGGEVVNLYFNIPEPVSYLSTYDTAIKMLKLHKEPIIELNSNEVRQLIEDKWDWSRKFWDTNMNYSQAAVLGSVNFLNDE